MAKDKDQPATEAEHTTDTPPEHDDDAVRATGVPDPADLVRGGGNTSFNAAAEMFRWPDVGRTGDWMPRGIYTEDERDYIVQNIIEQQALHGYIDPLRVIHDRAGLGIGVGGRGRSDILAANAADAQRSMRHIPFGDRIAVNGSPDQRGAPDGSR